MNIAVLGGGNVGTQFACVCASKGHDVNIFTSQPGLWRKDLEAHNDDGSITRGTVSIVSDDIAEVLHNRELIFITLPAFMFPKTSSMIAPLIHSGTVLCVIPGTGGAEFSFKDCIMNRAILSGLQRVPSVARLIERGKSVRAEGYRDRLKLAAIPHSEAPRIAGILSEIFAMPCDVLPNYLNVTLTPSNPILHTTRLRTLFADWHEGMTYPDNPRFYGSWSDESSRLLFKCDDELQGLCRVIDGLDLSEVKSLKLHYGSSTPEALTRKIRSIRSLNALLSPMKEQGGGWIPDFGSRYFTADFPCGLAIIEDIAELFGYDAPNIRSTMKWYRDITGDASHFRLKDFGVNSPEDFYAIYQQKGLDKMSVKCYSFDQTRPDQTRPDQTVTHARITGENICCVFSREVAA